MQCESMLLSLRVVMLTHSRGVTLNWRTVILRCIGFCSIDSYALCPDAIRGGYYTYQPSITRL